MYCYYNDAIISNPVFIRVDISTYCSKIISKLSIAVRKSR
ncbi:hypothetical protein BJ985_001390 [Corynebacterium tuberculostearicum]|nr:hypothetical protein [Corynebacterium tuberculostearicum]